MYVLSARLRARAEQIFPGLCTLTMRATFKVSRGWRSPQKVLATWLSIVMVFFLGLIVFSRKTDLRVVRDREGGHFEHDNHRVFDHKTGALGRSHYSTHGGHGAHSTRDSTRDFKRRTGVMVSKHATTVGDASRDIVGSSETFSTRFGLAENPRGSFVVGGKSGTSNYGDRSRRGEEDTFGDERQSTLGRTRLGGSLGDGTRDSGGNVGATRYTSVDRDDDPFSVHHDTKRKSGWMHELWGNAKRLTHEAEKKALLVDDWNFESEMERKPRELDDDETHEEIEAAEEKQQKLFDREAAKGARSTRPGIFW